MTAALYLQHPLSAAFPPMSDEEFQALKDSIYINDVLNPITIFEDQVIDGWHRYKAATELAMACPTVDMDESIDPAGFVTAQNKARRHITQAQMAMAMAQVYRWRANGGNQSAVPAECKSTAEMADIAGVGQRSMEQAKTVEKKAAPEVVAAVKRGDIGLEKAAAIAKLPMQEQAAAINKPLPRPAPKPAPVMEPEAPEYSELDRAHDQISELQSELVVARMGDVPDDQKTQAAERLCEQDAHIKTLEATLKAVTLSRDTAMTEIVQMKRQMAMQRKEIEKLGSRT